MSQLGKKFYRDPENGHACVIEICDMATGLTENHGTPVTGFKYKCVLCGREFVELTRSGYKQLKKYKRRYVLQWMDEESITRSKKPKAK